MATSSAAKSSSMAALVLVVAAAVMVGSFASGAHADSTLDLVNICNNDTVVYLGENVTGILVKAGQTVGLNLTQIQGIIGPVYFQVNGTLYAITSAELDGVVGTTGVLYQIQIICNGTCGEGVLTIRFYIQLYVDGNPVGPPITFTLCADVVVPGP